MEKEAVKAFFEETRRAGFRCKKSWEALEEEKQRAYMVKGADFHERVQGGRFHDVGDRVEQIEAATLAYAKACLTMCDMQGKALELVQLDDHMLRRAVLMDRFINRQSWEDVGKCMELNARYVMRLAAEAYEVIAHSSQAAGILERP